MLSLSCNFNLPKATPQTVKRISKYTQFSRNLSVREDANQSISSSTYVGPKEIIRVFMNLPLVTYDMLSFCTDCTVFEVCNKNLLFSVIDFQCFIGKFTFCAANLITSHACSYFFHSLLLVY